eukprot:2596867-Alexandrium_andersonii.AAC.1
MLLVEELKAAMPSSYHAMLDADNVRAGRQLNFRIVVVVDGGKKACWSLCKAARTAIEAKGINRNGRPVRASVQDSPERQQQKGILGRCLRACENYEGFPAVVPCLLYTSPSPRD